MGMQQLEEKVRNESLNKHKIQIYLFKLVLSINSKTNGLDLQKKSKILKKITNQYPKFGKAKITIKSFGIRKNEFISCFTTITKKYALKILVLLFYNLAKKY